MAIATLKGHVSRALDFFNKSNIYYGIGKSTACVDEFNPPLPLETDDLEETIGYKKAESIFLVVPDEEGAITYKDTSWRVVSPSNALTEGARWVYVSTYLSYDELPVDITYRQTAVLDRKSVV